MISIVVIYVLFFNKDIIKIIEYVYVYMQLMMFFFFLNFQELELFDFLEEEVDVYQQLVAFVNGNQYNNVIGQVILVFLWLFIICIYYSFMFKIG